MPLIVIKNNSHFFVKITFERNGLEIILENSNKSGQRCIHVMSMFSPDVTKQQKIFNDRTSEMTK